MHRWMKVLLPVPLVALALLAGGVLTGGAPRAAAIEQCPFADVWVGGTLNGPLQVSGACELWGVTLLNGVTIDGNGHLILTNSRIEGGVTVRGGGQFDTGTAIGSAETRNVVNGGITCLNGGTFNASTNTCLAR